MIITYYPHSKNIYNEKDMECENFRISKKFQIFKFLKIFYHLEMGCHVHDIRRKFLFYDAKSKYARVVNIFWYDSKL